MNQFFSIRAPGTQYFSTAQQDTILPQLTSQQKQVLVISSIALAIFVTISIAFKCFFKKTSLASSIFGVGAGGGGAAIPHIKRLISAPHIIKIEEVKIKIEEVKNSSKDRVLELTDYFIEADDFLESQDDIYDSLLEAESLSADAEEVVHVSENEFPELTDFF